MKKIIYIIVLMSFISSCNKWMDVVPKGKIIPSKTEDYRLLLDFHNGTGSAITTVANLDLWLTDDFDARSDLFGVAYSPYQEKAFKFEDHFYLESDEDASMQESYAAIYVFNTVIDEVLGVDGPMEERQKLYAEAKVHRAFSYLKMVNIYAKQYDKATANKDLGLSLVLKPMLTGSLARSSVQEVYDLIINDIKEVYEYLPNVADQLWRPSKSSASAILARAYLIMGDFENALKYAEESYKLYNLIIDYNTLDPQPWYPDLLDFGQRYKNNEQLLLKKPTSDYLYIYPSKSLEDLYDKTDDLRYKGKFYYEWDAPGTRYMYYYNQITGCSYGVTVPEMLLTRAECYARAGKIENAMNDVNLLRKKRIVTAAYKDLTANSKEEALQIVKDERRRELAFMGVRFSDLKRYNSYDNANISVEHVADGKKYVLAPGDANWAAPIARKYILKNPEIEQNPR